MTTQHSSDAKPLSAEMQARMSRYRAGLLTFGMQEPCKYESSVWHWRFFKPAAEWTAFVVNLSGNDEFIEIVYGYASTAFTRFAGDENALLERGVPDTEITLREKLIIRDEKDEEAARRQIADLYNRLSQMPKDDLLNASKAKRKAFLQQIALALKPLGFHKKANTWTLPLEKEYSLMFNAQKSTFSDEYYFNVYIGRNGSSRYGDCFSARVALQERFPVDWQSLSPQELASFLNHTVVPTLESIIRTPLKELGAIPAYWFGCHCDRQACDDCWMQKNLWEAKA